MTAAILIIVLATVVLSVLTYAAGHNDGWYDGWDKGWDECDQVTSELIELQDRIIKCQEAKIKELENGNEHIRDAE